MQHDDCEAVLQYFYYETMADGGTKLIEFRSPGATRTTHMKGQKTPRKYTFGKCQETSILISHVRLAGIRSQLTRLTPPGTCTLAIIIVGDFPIPDMLPGGYRTGPPTDLTTYLNLNRVAANLVEQCVFGRSEAGWQPTGQHDGIGVFVWSTNSEEDKEIEDEKARFAFSGLEMAGNGSAVTS